MQVLIPTNQIGLWNRNMSRADNNNQVHASYNIVPVYDDSVSKIESEIELRSIIAHIQASFTSSMLRNWDQLTKVFEIIHRFYARQEGGFRKMHLDTFPEFVARAVACCATRGQLMSLPRKSLGIQVFPWSEYTTIRFAHIIVECNDDRMLRLDDESDLDWFIRLLITSEELLQDDIGNPTLETGNPNE